MVLRQVGDKVHEYQPKIDNASIKYELNDEDVHIQWSLPIAFLVPQRSMIELDNSLLNILENNMCC